MQFNWKGLLFLLICVILISSVIILVLLRQGFKMLYLGCIALGFILGVCRGYILELVKGYMNKLLPKDKP
jgi:hypothetical protein